MSAGRDVLPRRSHGRQPNTSNHGLGYVIDIEGPTDVIQAICKPLGATVVYDELSHTHVEFARGIG